MRAFLDAGLIVRCGNANGALGNARSKPFVAQKRHPRLVRISLIRASPKSRIVCPQELFWGVTEVLVVEKIGGGIQPHGPEPDSRAC